MRCHFFFALILLVAGCSDQNRSNVAPASDQIVRLSDSELKGLDPQKISDLSSLRIAADQFEGLTRHNAKGEAEPGLAESWTVSADGLQWMFTMRPDIRFSDGQPIKAALFPKILQRLRAPETAAPAAAIFDNISGVTADNDRVIVALKNPFPKLPDLLTHPAIAAIPLHRISAAGDQWTSDRPMITSGAYRLENWQLNDHAKLIGNPNWHDALAPVPSIIWKPMDDSLSAMRLVLAGGADIAADYPASRHQWLKEHHPGLAHSVPYLGSYYFVFNTRKPPFDDVRVRTALSMAVERQWIAGKVINVGNIAAWGLLPPGLSGDQDYRPQWANWSREKRLNEARELLAEAGYGGKNPLSFEIRFNSSTEHRRVSVALAAMWKSLGVKATLFNSEAALHFAALRQHGFALSRSGWIADLPTPENFLGVHQTANGTGNYSGYDNPAFDKKLSAALKIAHPAERLAAMRAAEAMLMEDMPILPLYYYVTRSLVSKRVADWEDNISNVHPSRTLRIRAE